MVRVTGTGSGTGSGTGTERRLMRRIAGIDRAQLAFLRWYVRKHVYPSVNTDFVSCTPAYIRLMQLLRRLFNKTAMFRDLARRGMDSDGSFDSLARGCWTWTGYMVRSRTSVGGTVSYPEARIVGRQRTVLRFLYLCKHVRGYLDMVLNHWRDERGQDADGRDAAVPHDLRSPLYYALRTQDLDGTFRRRRPRFSHRCGNRRCINVTHIENVDLV
eukprot:TRINITY_DN467_c0_g1_i1.p2 TRINITY_DN467_c0_g1~~TRINITY_DN467_c0_g1_i1.p2  ORF type:complete len:215 (+),score=2.31 TRINITY_DN467_c0_g1_i1:2069-2713(+)